MKVRVDRKELTEATRAVSKFLPSSSSMEVLQHFLVEAHSGILAITASNMEAGRRIELEAEVEAQGDVLVPRSLTQVVSGGIGDEVKLSATDSYMTVGIGKATNRLRLGVRDSYPEVEPTMEDASRLPIQSWHKVQAVSAICGGPKSKVELQGVYFDGAEAVATDAYRLAYVTVSDEVEHASVIVPQHAIKSLDASVSALHVDERRVKADVTGGVWWARLIQGTYPKWRNPLNQVPEPVVTVQVDTPVLLGVLARAAAVVDTSTIPILLNIGQGEVTLTAKQADRGEFEEAFPAATDWHEGSEFEATYNARFLQSMVEPVESVEMRLVDSNRPVAIDGDGWWHGVLMPVKL